MHGHGSPNQNLLRLNLATGFLLLATLIAFAIRAELASAQNQQTFSDAQSIRQQTLPPTLTPAFPPSGHPLIEQNEATAFSHGYCRVNISWGGGESRVWDGAMRLTDGQMRHLTLLGSEPDVPGSIWLEGNGLGIRSRSGKTFSGVHVTLECSPGAGLQLLLVDREKKSEFATILPVAELLKGAVQYTIDETGNRIRIERVPGDELSVHMAGETTVFHPGTTLQFEILPRFLSFSKEKKMLLNVSLFRSRSNDRVFESEWPVIGDEIPVTSPAVSVAFTLPQEEEGVFDVVLTLYQKTDRMFGGSKDKVFVQRTFQCLVLSPTPPSGASSDISGGSNAGIQADYRGTLVENIDPSNPNWWRRFVKSPILPRIGSLGAAPAATTQYEQFPEPEPDRSTFDNVRDKFTQLSPGQLLSRPQERLPWQDNFGSGHLVPYQSTTFNTLGFVEMLPSRDETVTPWEAYAIPINEPGKPHFLEIDYLSGIEQTLGISIVEPTVSGGLFPGTVDSGLHVGRELVSDHFANHLAGRTMQHRILFWPKTKTPIILLTNPSTHQSAVYGGIHIYRAPDEFPQSLPQSLQPTINSDTTSAGRPQRLFASYWHRPHFCEAFSATRIPGQIPHIGVTDWETFRQGIDRTVQHARMVGYGGLMISVASDGSCLYPSRFMAPTPRYDSGVFLANGADPVRKDVLCALATALDRENMTLIPAIDFCMSLPAVEEQIRRNEQTNIAATPAESGLTWVGPYGNLLVDQFGEQNRTGRLPYYNLLNPVVQNAMLDVVRELVARTAHHPSFGGIAVQLSPEGYAMLPEEYWGLDDDTMARFSRDTRIIVPGEGADRFTTRAESIRSHCLEAWLRWRADQVTEFYRRIAEIVTDARPDAKLYLAGAKLFDSPLSQRAFYPSMTQSGSAAYVMICHGFDVAALRGDSRIVLMRPEKVIADNNLANIAMNLELLHAEDMTATFHHHLGGQVNRAASLFYHQPIERTLPTFDVKSPYQPAQSRFSTEAVPAGDQNRKRFVRHLADHDVAVFFDGGDTIPLGEEDALRDMVMQFQMLPSGPFQRYGDNEDQTTQPVTVRYLNTERGTYCYLVNDAAFSVPVRVRFETGAGSRIGSLSPLRDTGISRTVSDGLEWSQTLRPYHFTAFLVSDPKAKLKQVEVSPPANVTGANGQLEKQIRQLNFRIRFLRNWLEWDRLPNGNFEMSLAQWHQYLNEQQQLAQAATSGGTTRDHDKSPYARPRSLAALGLPSLGNLFSGRSGNAVVNPTNTSPDVASQNHHSDPVIPGWFVEGDATFRATVEARPCREGAHCLHLAAQQNGGRMTSMPFDAPKTGRLFVTLWVGVAQDATQLPFRLVVKGKHQNRPFIRSATIGPAIWDAISQTPADAGIRWHPVVVPFKDLPLTGLEPLTVSLEVYRPASVWVDDLRLYHLAFTDEEQTTFATMLSFAHWRNGKGCISDTLAILEGYWPQLLAECLPNIEELVAQQALANPAPSPQPEPQATPTPSPAADEPKKKTLAGRITETLKFWR